MTWRSTLTLVLLAAALITGWSAWRQRGDTPDAAVASARPSFLLRDFELVGLDTLGKEAFTVTAPQLSQDASDKTLSLQQPVFFLPDKDGQRWKLRSKTGWVAADNSEVRLRGKVVADSPPGTPPTRMKTEKLNVFPDRHQAISPVPVAVTAAASTMRGSTMRANLATRRIQLTNTRMTDEPTRR